VSKKPLETKVQHVAQKGKTIYKQQTEASAAVSRFDLADPVKRPEYENKKHEKLKAGVSSSWGGVREGVVVYWGADLSPSVRGLAQISVVLQFSGRVPCPPAGTLPTRLAPNEKGPEESPHRQHS